MDSSTVKNNPFIPPFVARYVRIQPVNYEQKPALRLELLGCDLNSELLSQQQKLMEFVWLYLSVENDSSVCVCDQAAPSLSGSRGDWFLTPTLVLPHFIPLCCAAGNPASPGSTRKAAPTPGGQRWTETHILTQCHVIYTPSDRVS